jgi:hypothetical protein
VLGAVDDAEAALGNDRFDEEGARERSARDFEDVCD